MLQQTRVERVLPRFEPWSSVARGALAAAPRDVIRAWSGLGYNRRAVNLHRARRGSSALGGFPRTGRSCAAARHRPVHGGAIASFAFGQDVPAIDVNLRRVIGRVAFGHDRCRAAAGRGVRAWNQALFDVGATALPRARAALRGRLPAGGGVPVARQLGPRPRARPGATPRARAAQRRAALCGATSRGGAATRPAAY